MSTKMLIDARHEEETRVTIVRGSRVEDFDYENIARKQLKGSIYLARVTRVEPSLQAAFVEYGGNRHGFLAFSEIHPDYYQIPTEDREALRQEMLESVERMTQEERAREAGDDSDEADEDEAPKPSRSTRGRRTRRSRSSRDTAQDTPVNEDADVSDDADADTEVAEEPIDLGDEPEAVEASEDGSAPDEEVTDDEPSVADEPDSEPDDTAPESAAEADVADDDDDDDSDDERSDTNPDVIAEDTGADDEDKAAVISEDLPVEEASAESGDGDGTPGKSGLITLEEPIVDYAKEESLEETVAEALASSAQWQEAAPTTDEETSEGDAETTEEGDEEKRGRRRTRRRGGTRRGRGGRGRKADAETVDGDEEQDAEALESSSADDQVAEDGDDDADPVKPQMTDREMIEAIVRRRMLKAMRRRYSIQEVIKKRQIILVQVAKEERGNKGAALTTYISLAGRYCVLMPNSTHSGGVSRKISSASDRRRLKSVIADLSMPSDMGLIIRTAGMTRTKAEIKRDYDYLLRLWNDIRSLTLSSVAPALIYEEADLIRRSIRDMYTRDVEEILVEGERGYRAAKDFMKLLVPSHAKRVQHYKDRIPLFHRFQVESQLESMYQPSVSMRSGGYVVINPTEALISIDVNSGRSTKEHNIEETALKTNLEAAEEVARQLRLRDMAGLVVIDFIDMEDRSNIRAVEKRMKEAVKSDRARIQVGRISMFGLMEMSRQRLRPNLLEASTVECPHCKGTGTVLSQEAAALSVLRKLEEEGIRARSTAIDVKCHPDVATFLLNAKREALVKLERAYGFSVTVSAALDRGASDSELVRSAGTPQVAATTHIDVMPDLEDPDTSSDEAVGTEDDAPQARGRARTPRDEDQDEDGRPRRRRRRRRRGGRRRDEETDQQSEDVREDASEDAEGAEQPTIAAETVETEDEDDKPRRRRGRRGGRRRRGEAADTAGEAEETAGQGAADGADTEQADEGSQTPLEAEETISTDTEASPETAETATETAEEEAVEAPAAEPEQAAAEDGSESTETDQLPEPEAETAAPKQPVASEEIEVKMVSDAASEKPKKKGWWSR